MADPVNAIRAAIQDTEERARDRAYEAMTQFDGTDPTVLILAAGEVQGIAAGADFFKAALQKALKDDPDNDDEDN